MTASPGSMRRDMSAPYAFGPEVLTDEGDLDRTAVARAFLFDDHHTILRLFARTGARQTNH